jgi:hypothetical protein
MASYNNTFNQQKQQANLVSSGAVPPGYNPIDPSQLMALQALQQNPNGDQFNSLNGPDDKKKKGWMSWGPSIPGVGCTFPELGAAAGAGAVLGTAIHMISENAIDHAQSLQGFVGVRQVNDLLGKMSAPGWLAKSDFWQYLNYYPKYHVPGDPVQSANNALQAMKVRSLQRVVPNFESKLKPHWRLWGKSADASSSYNKLLQDIQGHMPELQERHKVRFFQDLGMDQDAAREAAQKEPGSLYHELKGSVDFVEKDDLKALEGKLKDKNLNDSDKKYLNDLKEKHLKNVNVINELKKQGVEDVTSFNDRVHLKLVDVVKTAKEGHPTAGDFHRIVDNLHAKIDFLEDKKKVTNGKLSNEEAKLLYSMKGFRDRLQGGVKEFLGSSYRDKALLQARMRKAELGPIGRAYVLAFSHLRSIFGGETMTGGLMNKAERLGKGGLPQIILGSLFGAAFIIGPAIHAANEAKPGEKKASFFENFIGFGIFNMAGWELGRHFMDSTKLVERGLGRHSLKHPLGFMRFLPGVGHFFGTITLAGFVAELSAMFIFGAGFEQLGNWVSHKLFGKPSPPDDQESKAQAAQSNQLPASANVAGMKAAQQAQSGMSAGYADPPPPYPMPMPYSPPAPYTNTGIPPQTAYSSYGNPAAGYTTPPPPYSATPPSGGVSGLPKGMPAMPSSSPDVQAILQDPAFQKTTRYLNQMMPNIQQGQQ